ncbi:MAG: chitobiase/beta-hexosaminidase C-terminal domain-containing protein [Bacteroidales bacterium]|nr:chitobiase/beta-hexosaminidase C-terminal domain-containing protein [Bacteroidales bacterium]
MKKFLLSIMTAVAALTTGYAAQSVTLDFTDPTKWTNKANGEAVPTTNKTGYGTAETTITDGTNSVTFKAQTNAYFISNSNQWAFFIGQKDSYINVPQVDFQVGTIDLVFGNNVTTSVTVDFFVGETAFGQVPTVEKSGTATWNVPEALSAVGTQYTLKVTNAKNFQVAKIILNEYEAPEVNAPVISPAGGVFAKAQTVTITGDEGCAFYYTLDGTDPSDASTAYAGPFEVSKSTVVKAIAYNEEDCGSAITTAEFHIAYAYYDFLKDQQGWTIDNKNVPEGKQVWNLDAQYGMKATGYWDKVAHATESWLVSPAISLAEATNPVVTIAHASGNYSNASVSDYVSVLVSADGGEWTALDITNWPTSWTYVNSVVDLKSYVGKNIQLAIRYTSTDQLAGTYETKMIEVAEGQTVEYKHIANTQDKPYTTAEAKALVDDPLSILTETVYVKGIVSKIDALTEDGALTYWLDNDSFEVYQGLGLEGAKFQDKNGVHKGDTVVVKGTITLYKGTYEFAAGSEVVELGKNKDAVDIKDPSNTAETAYSVTASIAIVKEGSDVWDLDKSFFVKGIVTKTPSYAPSKKAITFGVRDVTNVADSLQVYQVKGLENTEIADEETGKAYVKEGDEVVLYGKVVYNESKKHYEIAAGGYIYSINGRTSGIEEVKTEENAADAEVEIYNILGQKVETMDAKGIYFVNGKKVIVR